MNKAYKTIANNEWLKTDPSCTPTFDIFIAKYVTAYFIIGVN